MTFCDHFGALVPDHEDADSGFDNIVGDGLELVDLKHSHDLRKEAFEEAEVAPSPPRTLPAPMLVDHLAQRESLPLRRVLGDDAPAQVATVLDLRHNRTIRLKPWIPSSQ